MILGLLFTFVAIVGNVTYLSGLKLADGRINPFFFTFLLSAVALIGHTVTLLFYRYVMGEQVNLFYDSRGALLAVLVGLAVVVIDFSLFFAFRHGSAINTHVALAVGTAISFAAVSVWLFGESVTPTRAVGIGLGLVSLVLVVRG